MQMSMAAAGERNGATISYGVDEVQDMASPNLSDAAFSQDR